MERFFELETRCFCDISQYAVTSLSGVVVNIVAMLSTKKQEFILPCSICFAMQYSYYHLYYHCHGDVYCIFQILFKMLYERSCNCFFCRAPCSQASMAIRKCRIFFLIKITNMSLKIDFFLSFSWLFLNCSPKEAINCFFVERPIHIVKYSKQRIRTTSPDLGFRLLTLIQDQITKNLCILCFHDVLESLVEHPL